MNQKIHSIQKQLLFDITEQLKRQQKGLPDLAALLGVKTTAMYTRLSGKKLLSFQELNILCTHFNISLDALLQGKNRIEFDLPSLTKPILSGKDYLLRLGKYVEWAEQNKVELFYITSEIPIFYYFQFEELGLFKLFIYERTVWESEKTKNNRFSFDLHDKPFFQSLFRKLTNTFLSFDTHEIWNINILDHTLNQLRYYVESGLFENKKDALIICEQLKQLVKRQENSAEKGFKQNRHQENAGGILNLYLNKITHTNNTILVKSETVKAIFNTYDNPNYLIIRDAAVWDYTFIWYNKLRKRSEAISNNSERARLAMFNELNKKINCTQRQIDTHFD